ncbi:hypothetical protein EIP86_001268 [Pleurotus ostreatoroseus]|nr:hypothetical protein EIP86_001268 [Pleurotus ostreatoroseus]
MDEGKPIAQCLVVQDTKFVDVGSQDEVQARWALSAGNDGNTSTSKLPIRFVRNGAIIVPGMTDSHAHTLEYGFTKLLPIEGTRTVKETVNRVRNFIEADTELLHNKTRLIEGWGWDHTKWVEALWPVADAFEKDSVVAGRPIILQSKDGHALWVSKAILSKMEPIPEEVEGGVIVRDASGQPTGVLLDNAQELANALRPEPTYEQLEQRFNLTVKDAVKYGLTSIHDAGFDPISLSFFRRYAVVYGLRRIRIYGMTHFNESAEYWGDKVDKLIGAGNGRLTARSVKIFADGKQFIWSSFATPLKLDNIKALYVPVVQL